LRVGKLHQPPGEVSLFVQLPPWCDVRVEVYGASGEDRGCCALRWFDGVWAVFSHVFTFFSPINFFELSLGQEMDFLSTSHSNFDPYISAVDVL
jgi:hypothetical protein